MRRIISWCFLLVTITVNQSAFAQSTVIDVEWINIFGDPGITSPQTNGATVAINHPTAADGFNFILASEAHIMMLNTLISAMASDRQVKIDYVASCGCECSYAITSITLE